MSEHKPEYAVRSLDELKEIADKFNCDLVIASSSQLLLDIDDAPFPADIGVLRHAVLQVVAETYRGCETVEVWKSRNGGTHVLIQLGIPVSLEEAIGLQAVLGSDPLREVIALKSAREMVEDTRSLFRPRWKE